MCPCRSRLCSKIRQCRRRRRSRRWRKRCATNNEQIVFQEFQTFQPFHQFSETNPFERLELLERLKQLEQLFWGKPWGLRRSALLALVGEGRLIQEGPGRY